MSSLVSCGKSTSKFFFLDLPYANLNFHVLSHNLFQIIIVHIHVFLLFFKFTNQKQIKFFLYFLLENKCYKQFEIQLFYLLFLHSQVKMVVSQFFHFFFILSIPYCSSTEQRNRFFIKMC